MKSTVHNTNNSHYIPNFPLIISTFFQSKFKFSINLHWPILRFLYFKFRDMSWIMISTGVGNVIRKGVSPDKI